MWEELVLEMRSCERSELTLSLKYFRSLLNSIWTQHKGGLEQTPWQRSFLRTQLLEQPVDLKSPRDDDLRQFQKHADDRIWQTCCGGNTVAAFTADCHCVRHRFADRYSSWTVLFPLHATSISCNHSCHCGACYYRARWVPTIRLVTPHNSPVIQGEINVSTTRRHFSLISFPWWWREVLFNWHLNSSSRD